MSLEAKMTKTVSIYRGIASRSATGTVTRPKAPSVTATCRGFLMPEHGAVSLGEGLIFEADARLIVPASADLRPETAGSTTTGQFDMVVIDAVWYEVVSVRNVAERGRFQEVMLKRSS